MSAARAERAVISEIARATSAASAMEAATAGVEAPLFECPVACVDAASAVA